MGGISNTISSGRMSLYLQSFVGKSWYVLISTFGLAGIGLYALFEKLILSIKGKQTDSVLSSLFLLLSILGIYSVGVLSSTITLSGDVNRLDVLFYGRYTDYAVLLLLPHALIWLREHLHQKRYWIVVLTVTIFTALFGIAIYQWVKPLTSFYINLVTVPGIYLSKSFDVRIITLFAILLFLLITILWWSLQYIPTMSLRRVCYVIPTCLNIFAFIHVANNGYNLYIAPHQQVIQEDLSVSQIVSEYDYPTYYEMHFNEVHYDVFGQRLRTQLLGNDLYYTAPDSSVDDYFRIVSASEWFNDNIGDLESNHFLLSTSGYVLTAHGDALLKQLHDADIKTFAKESCIPLEYDHLFLQLTDNISVDQNTVSVPLSYGTDVNAYYINSHSLKLSYHIYDSSCNNLIWEGSRTAIQDGSCITEMKITSDIFDTPGDYILAIDIVEEGVAWYSSLGLHPLELNITIP